MGANRDDGSRAGLFTRRCQLLTRPRSAVGRRPAMIRCVRMWTGEDGDSLFEEGWIDLSSGVVYENGADLHFKPEHEGSI